MLHHPTYEKLAALKLTGMKAALAEQAEREDIGQMPFMDRLALVLDREAMVREDRQLTSRLRRAKLRYPEACLEDLDRRGERALPLGLIEQLSNPRWIRERRNILISGATGVGKSFLACALAQKACRDGFLARYMRLPMLLGELRLGHADGTYAKRFKELSRIRVLVLDDYGLSVLDDDERRELLEILEDRYQRGSTIVTSQLPVSQWHEAIGDPTFADAILDRLVHNTYRIDLKGESMRKRLAEETPD